MAKAKRKTHGGRRKGAGRPALVPGEETVKVAVTLLRRNITKVEQRRAARRLKNFSAALRDLIDEA